MTKVRFTTTPETFSTELCREEESYIETILPALNKISPNKLPTQFTKNQQKLFLQLLEIDLRKRLELYEPSRGNPWTEIIFNKEYLLTKLNHKHEAIHLINYLYENILYCIENNLSLNVYYSE